MSDPNDKHVYSAKRFHVGGTFVRIVRLGSARTAFPMERSLAESAE
ncbi:MAG: hypothetical protein ACREUQ_15130 [Burkholderiales bacterium]